LLQLNPRYSLRLLNHLHVALESWEGLKDAILLMKRWVKAKTMPGHLLNFPLSILLAHCCYAGAKRSASGLELFKLMLTFLASSCKGTNLANPRQNVRKHVFKKKNPMKGLQGVTANAGAVNLFVDNLFNVFYKLPSFLGEELRHESKRKFQNKSKRISRETRRKNL
jgi:hypothetical protein